MSAGAVVGVGSRIVPPAAYLVSSFINVIYCQMEVHITAERMTVHSVNCDKFKLLDSKLFIVPQKLIKILFSVEQIGGRGGAVDTAIM